MDSTFSENTFPVSFTKALKVFQKLNKLPRYEMLGYPLNGKLFLGLCAVISNVLSTKDKIVYIETIQATLSSYVGKTITTELLADIYLYISHNCIDLQFNKATPPSKPIGEKITFLTCVKIDELQIIDNTIYVTCVSVWGTDYGKRYLYIISKNQESSINRLLYESGINNRRNNDGVIGDLTGCCFYANVWLNKNTSKEQCSGLHCSEYLKKINKTKYKSEKSTEAIL